MIQSPQSCLQCRQKFTEISSELQDHLAKIDLNSKKIHKLNKSHFNFQNQFILIQKEIEEIKQKVGLNERSIDRKIQSKNKQIENKFSLVRLKIEQMDKNIQTAEERFKKKFEKFEKHNRQLEQQIKNINMQSEQMILKHSEILDNKMVGIQQNMKKKYEHINQKILQQKKKQEKVNSFIQQCSQRNDQQISKQNKIIQGKIDKLNQAIYLQETQILNSKLLMDKMQEQIQIQLQSIKKRNQKLNYLNILFQREQIQNSNQNFESAIKNNKCQNKKQSKIIQSEDQKFMNKQIKIQFSSQSVIQISESSQNQKKISITNKNFQSSGKKKIAPALLGLKNQISNWLKNQIKLHQEVVFIKNLDLKDEKKLNITYILINHYLKNGLKLSKDDIRILASSKIELQKNEISPFDESAPDTISQNLLAIIKKVKSAPKVTLMFDQAKQIYQLTFMKEPNMIAVGQLKRLCVSALQIKNPLISNYPLQIIRVLFQEMRLNQAQKIKLENCHLFGKQFIGAAEYKHIKQQLQLIRRNSIQKNKKR